MHIRLASASHLTLAGHCVGVLLFGPASKFSTCVQHTVFIISVKQGSHLTRVEPVLPSPVGETWFKPGKKG